MLKVQITTNQTTHRIELPSQQPVSQLLAQMAERFNLSGELSLLHQDSRLLPDVTLTGAGVKNGDTLELMSAGMGGTNV